MSEQGQQLHSRVPILPLRDVVVYPHMVIPLFVGRDKSIVALDEAMNSDKQILLVAQKQADIDEPTIDDIYEARHPGHDPAAAEAPRRHRQGAGRRRFARGAVAKVCRRLLFGRHPADRRRSGCRDARSRRAEALGDFPVRALCEAQQEGAARNPDFAVRHRSARVAWPIPWPRTCP